MLDQVLVFSKDVRESVWRRFMVLVFVLETKDVEAVKHASAFALCLLACQQEANEGLGVRLAVLVAETSGDRFVLNQHAFPNAVAELLCVSAVIWYC